jgi:hypothetical protein
MHEHGNLELSTTVSRAHIIQKPLLKISRTRIPSSSAPARATRLTPTLSLSVIRAESGNVDPKLSLVYLGAMSFKRRVGERR